MPFSFRFSIFFSLIAVMSSSLFGKQEGVDLSTDYHVYCVPEMGACFYVDEVPDGIKWHLRQGIYWESTIGRLIEKYTKEGSTAIDVGAHLGIHTITMSRKVGGAGKVVAFEPQHKMYTELLGNLALNGCLNVNAYRMALGEENRMIQLNQRNPENEGGTAIGTGGDDAQMVTLDSLELTNVSLIKIDVERYEYFVLQGARETILKNKPVIIFELLSGDDYFTCDAETKQQFDNVFDFVRSLGYRVDLIFGADYIALPNEM